MKPRATKAEQSSEGSRLNRAYCGLVRARSRSMAFRFAREALVCASALIILVERQLHQEQPSRMPHPGRRSARHPHRLTRLPLHQRGLANRH